MSMIAQMKKKKGKQGVAADPVQATAAPQTLEQSPAQQPEPRSVETQPSSEHTAKQSASEKPARLSRTGRQHLANAAPDDTDTSSLARLQAAHGDKPEQTPPQSQSERASQATAPQSTESSDRGASGPQTTSNVADAAPQSSADVKTKQHDDAEHHDAKTAAIAPQKSEKANSAPKPLAKGQPWDEDETLAPVPPPKVARAPLGYSKEFLAMFSTPGERATLDEVFSLNRREKLAAEFAVHTVWKRHGSPKCKRLLKNSLPCGGHHAEALCDTPRAEAAQQDRLAKAANTAAQKPPGGQPKSNGKAVPDNDGYTTQTRSKGKSASQSNGGAQPGPSKGADGSRDRNGKKGRCTRCGEYHSGKCYARLSGEEPPKHLCTTCGKTHSGPCKFCHECKVVHPDLKICAKGKGRGKGKGHAQAGQQGYTAPSQPRPDRTESTRYHADGTAASTVRSDLAYSAAHQQHQQQPSQSQQPRQGSRQTNQRSSATTQSTPADEPMSDGPSLFQWLNWTDARLSNNLQLSDSALLTRLAGIRLPPLPQGSTLFMHTATVMPALTRELSGSASGAAVVQWMVTQTVAPPPPRQVALAQAAAASAVPPRPTATTQPAPTQQLATTQQQAPSQQAPTSSSHQETMDAVALSLYRLECRFGPRGQDGTP